MNYEISEQGTAVEIRVHDVGDQEPELLPSFQECQSGSCGCPTDQYDKLAKMDVDAADGDVTLRMEPRPGERLDTEQLRVCLDYTLSHAEQ